MQTEIKSILNRINTRRNKLNVFGFLTHEAAQSNLAKTGHDFFLVPTPHKQTWDFHTRPLPKNCYILGGLPTDLHVDVILAEEKSWQLPKAKEIQQMLGVPIIAHNHTMPIAQNQKQLEYFQNLKGDINTYITSYSRKAFNDEQGGIVINNAVDTDVFNSWKPTRKGGVTVVNHLMGRGQFYSIPLFEGLRKEIPLTLVGENPGLSQSISDPTQLAKTIGSYEFYANLSIYSPLSMSLAEAAALGMPILSTKMQATEDFFVHGENALLTNDPAEYIEFAKLLVSDKDLATKLGAGARKMALERFSLSMFIDKWNTVLWKVYNREF